MWIVNESTQNINLNTMFKPNQKIGSYINGKVLIEERMNELNVWDCGEDLRAFRKYEPNMLCEEEVQYIVELLNKSAKIAAAKVESNRVHIMLKLKNGNQTGMGYTAVREAIRTNSLKHIFIRISTVH